MLDDAYDLRVDATGHLNAPQRECDRLAAPLMREGVGWRGEHHEARQKERERI